jgi:hypothetical protein
MVKTIYSNLHAKAKSENKKKSKKGKRARVLPGFGSKYRKG